MSETSENVMSRLEQLEEWKEELTGRIEELENANNFRDINKTLAAVETTITQMSKDFEKETFSIQGTLDKLWKHDATRLNVIQSLKLLLGKLDAKIEEEKQKSESSQFLRQLFLQLAYHPEKIAEALPKDFLENLKKGILNKKE